MATTLSFGNKQATQQSSSVNNNRASATTQAQAPQSEFERLRQAALNSNKAKTKDDKQPKEQVKFWLNIGKNISYNEELTDPVTGEVILDNEGNPVMEEKDVFVGLDVSIDLESIKVRTNNSNSAFSQALTMNKEMLLEQLLEIANRIPEGQQEIIEGIDVQIRHAGSNQKVKEIAKEHPMTQAFVSSLNLK